MPNDQAPRKRMIQLAGEGHPDGILEQARADPPPFDWYRLPEDDENEGRSERFPGAIRCPWQIGTLTEL